MSLLPLIFLVAVSMVAVMGRIVNGLPVDLSSHDNATMLSGTWSSGSGAVQTGLGFFNPITKVFTLPQNSGISYSFTEDGFWESAQFTYKSNPQNNRCFTAALTWQHGTYTFNRNDSLSLKPYPADGFVQVIDPCGGQTVAIYNYFQFEVIPLWYNYLDGAPGFQDGGSAYALQLYNDGGDGQAGAAKSVMWLRSRPPTMLPTKQLYQEVLNPQF